MTTQPPIIDAASAIVRQGAIDALTNNQRQLDVDGCEVGVSRQALDELLAGYAALSSQIAPLQADPINMILHCPRCHLQHVDEQTPDWTNPPHKSHLCRPEDGGCGCIWRPADVATNGVSAIETCGKADTWTVETAQADPGMEAELERAMLRLGSLGLNPKMPDDLADLCARLGAMGSHGFKDYPTHSINPDGEEAAAAIEHLNTQVQALQSSLALQPDQGASGEILSAGRPDGESLPIDPPTEAMLDAGEDGWRAVWPAGKNIRREVIASVWKAMMGVASRPAHGELVAALEKIAEGDEPRPVGKVWRSDGKPSKHDKCIHDRWMYEDCGECVAEFARRALGAGGVE